MLRLKYDFVICVRNKRAKNTDGTFELLIRMLLILQDPRRDLICMLGYALAPRNPHAFEDYARACVPMGKGEARGRREWEGRKLVQTFHFAARRVAAGVG